MNSDSAAAGMHLNTALAGRLHRGVGVDLAGSIYAVPAPARPAMARLLARRQAWVHADVFADARDGVSLDLIADLASS
ncbi:MAG: hypothetical protein QOK26_1538, partial [Pseudonocardiales bacterium]|nr:hypothetical protein [Pseudonocardiales bacterium]